MVIGVLLGVLAFKLVRQLLSKRSNAEGQVVLLDDLTRDAGNNEHALRDAEEASASELLGWPRYLRFCLAMALLSFSVVLSSTMEIIDCVDIDGVMRLRGDIRVECGVGEL